MAFMILGQNSSDSKTDHLKAPFILITMVQVPASYLPRYIYLGGIIPTRQNLASLCILGVESLTRSAFPPILVRCSIFGRNGTSVTRLVLSKGGENESLLTSRWLKLEGYASGQLVVPGCITGVCNCANGTCIWSWSHSVCLQTQLLEGLK